MSVRRAAAVSLPALLALGLAGGSAIAVPPVAAEVSPPRVPLESGSAAAFSSQFSVGELQSTVVGAPGCGTNAAGEPQIRVGYDNTIVLASEDGLGNGTEAWRTTQPGGPGASACAATYVGQPDGVAHTGPSGGDVDIAIGSARLATGQYPVYVSSLNLASVFVATSTDGGVTYATKTPVVEGVPVDDREWIAAVGATTALLSYHDAGTGNIDILRSDDTGATFVQRSRAIPPTDYKAMNNEIGTLAIDRRHGPSGGPATPADFWSYQAFVAPSSSSGTAYNEAFLAVSSDGGTTWTDRAVPCSIQPPNVSLGQQFPQVSVAPSGDLWMTWSAGQSDSNNNAKTGAIYTAKSTDHGAHWTCSPKLSAGVAVMPWLVATQNPGTGAEQVDLVWYQSPSPTGTWTVQFAQNLTGSPTAWGGRTTVTPVHTGGVCLGGVSCTGSRQLYDDFGVSTDTAGWAHIAYSHDDKSGGTYTGYAVQTGGTPVGYVN